MQDQEIRWRTVFDLLEVGYQHWGFAVTGLVTLVVSLGLRVLGRTAMKGRHPLLADSLPKAVVVIAAVFTLVAFLPTYLPYRALRAAVEAGEVEVLQGTVRAYRPARPAADEPESFELGGRTFRYADRELSPGFHTTALRGGPIREGLLVRLAHVDGEIVRLEVAE